VKLYGKTEPTFWTGETGCRLRGHLEAQVLAHYLITCPHSNMIGLYYVALPTICYETGLSPEGASKGLQSLFEGDFAYYDQASGHVYVKNMARIQIGESLEPADKRHKGVINLLKMLRKSPFFLDFYGDYQVRFMLPDVSIFQAGLEAPLKGLRRGLGDPPKPVAVAVAVAVAEKIKTPVAPMGGVSVDGASCPSSAERACLTLSDHCSSLQGSESDSVNFDAMSSSESLQVKPVETTLSTDAHVSKSEDVVNLTHASAIVGDGKKTKRARNTAMPTNFGISDSVRRWAEEKGFTRLEERLEHFRSYAIARGATYANWDQAFMNSVRDDWAKLNGKRAFVTAATSRRPVVKRQERDQEEARGELIPCPPDIAAELADLKFGALRKSTSVNAGGGL